MARKLSSIKKSNLKVQNIQRDKLCLLDVIVAGKKGHELKSLFDEKVCYTIAN